MRDIYSWLSHPFLSADIDVLSNSKKVVDSISLVSNKYQRAEMTQPNASNAKDCVGDIIVADNTCKKARCTSTIRSLTSLPTEILESISTFICTHDYIFSFQYVDKIMRQLSYYGTACDSETTNKHKWIWDESEIGWVQMQDAKTNVDTETKRVVADATDDHDAESSITSMHWNHVGIASELDIENFAKSLGPFRISDVRTMVIQINMINDNADTSISKPNTPPSNTGFSKLFFMQGRLMRIINAPHFRNTLRVLHIYSETKYYPNNYWNFSQLMALQSLRVGISGCIDQPFIVNANPNSLTELYLEFVNNTGLAWTQPYPKLRVLEVTDAVIFGTHMVRYCPALCELRLATSLLTAHMWHPKAVLTRLIVNYQLQINMRAHFQLFMNNLNASIYLWWSISVVKTCNISQYHRTCRL